MTTAIQRLIAARRSAPAAPERPLERVLALSEVKPYERIEHGKIEHVGSYETKHVSDASPLGGVAYPSEMEHQGYFTDALGEKHWGWQGAAGLLVHHTDENGVRRYLLQKRAGGVQHGGTWSTPGGAIDEGETPEQAALREAHEEFGEMPDNLKITSTDVKDFGTPGQTGHWSYSTVHAESPRMFTPGKSGPQAKMGFESAGFKWVTPEEMGAMNLHPGFAPSAQALGATLPPVPEGKPASKPYAPYSERAFATGDKVMARLGEFPVAGTVSGEPDAEGRVPVSVEGGHLQRYAADLNHVHAPGEAVWTRDHGGKIVQGTVLSAKGNNYDVRLPGETEADTPHYRRGSELRKLHELTEEQVAKENSKPPPKPYKPPQKKAGGYPWDVKNVTSNVSLGGDKSMAPGTKVIHTGKGWSGFGSTGTVIEAKPGGWEHLIQWETGYNAGHQSLTPTSVLGKVGESKTAKTAVKPGTAVKAPSGTTGKFAVGDKVRIKDYLSGHHPGTVTEVTPSMYSVQRDDGKVDHVYEHELLPGKPAPAVKQTNLLGKPGYDTIAEDAHYQKGDRVRIKARKGDNGADTHGTVYSVFQVKPPGYKVPVRGYDIQLDNGNFAKRISLGMQPA